ncbi:MAG TPA: hypothetical protein DCS21_05410, partial [Gammaproteobacteria bacterium]|nr:hypothetical protein [Gammaproteobacteria bacterium]
MAHNTFFILSAFQETSIIMCIRLMIASLLLWWLTPMALAQTSSDGVWTVLPESTALSRTDQTPRIQPDQFRLLTLDPARLSSALGRVPHEQAGQTPSRFELPMPTGELATFALVEAPVMAPELAARYPQIRTYAGQQVDNPAVRVRLDWTPQGFHAQVISPEGTWYIDPYLEPDNVYVSYYKRDYHPSGKTFHCGVHGELAEGTTFTPVARSGDQLRTYRLAVATTGEYGQFQGGVKEKVLAAVVTTINRVTGIYEYELAVRLMLVANNDTIMYVDPNTDPFQGNDDAETLIEESQTVIDAQIGSANYDIGHTFSTGAGGLAGLGVVCQNGWKGGGVTGSEAPVNDPYDVDFVAHEIGHQFGGNHTFNGALGSCSGSNRNGPTAYEPGSGSTIMAYAGICGTDNLQRNSDPLFHSASHDEIGTYIAVGATCGVVTPLRNLIPVVDAGADFTIPAQTPFVLTGSATDADTSDVLTYLWEERDLGPQAQLNVPDDGQIPLFRVWTTTTTGERYFPQLKTLLANTTEDAEKLPQLSRTLNFRLTVRDGRGGVDADDMQVVVDDRSGPFQVTAPNTSGQTLTGGSSLTVGWKVANTTAVPVNCGQVNILLSTDAGQTFTQTLAAATPNDGSQAVTLPNVAAAQVRIMVQCANNIFFDVSDHDFAITPGTTTPTADAVGVFQDGTWFLDANANGARDNCTDDYCYSFGLSIDQPVVGNWNGDGRAKVGVFRAGNWYLDANG